MSRNFGAAIVTSALFSIPSYAAVTISSQPTQNMSCSNGICAPTAGNAVLNASDLENLLASGNVTVTTTGSGDVQAGDIDVTAAIGWSSANRLSLDVYGSVFIDKKVSVAGTGGLSLVTNDGGSGGVFSIGRKGNVLFQSLSSQLIIDGNAYSLVNSLPALASAIASNPGGSFALANSYDAKADGTYTASPIQTNFSGHLDGLGNSISNLSIKSLGSNFTLGLFNNITSGTLEHMNLDQFKITTSENGDQITGALAGTLEGYFFEDSATGSIVFRGVQTIGGLVSTNGGRIEDCFSSVVIAGTRSKSSAGGLAVFNGGTIVESFSVGTVTVGASSVAGGLTAYNYDSSVENSYATGAVTGGSRSKIGGFIGEEVKKSFLNVSTSYSAGGLSAGPSGLAGGFVGVSSKNSQYTDAYWDTTSSGTGQAAGKGKSPGVEGLTTEQLQSGLPNGFDPAVWGENPKINNGLPYLLNNPPPKK